MFDQGILFFCYLSDVTHTNLEIRNHSGNFWWLTAARARYYSVRKLLYKIGFQQICSPKCSAYKI